MGSVEDLVAGLNSVVGESEALRGQLLVAADQFDQAQALFGKATYGTNSHHPKNVFASLEAVRESVGQAHALLAGMENYLGMYIQGVTDTAALGGSTTSAGGPDTTGLDEREWRLGWDYAVRRFRAGEVQTARRVEDQRRTVLVRWPDDDGPDWVGPDGKTYDAVGNFPGKHFDRQWENLQGRILQHMEKADWVPVDVSRFTPEQIKRVQEFIKPLGSRVFIVGM